MAKKATGSETKYELFINDILTGKMNTNYPNKNNFSVFLVFHALLKSKAVVGRQTAFSSAIFHFHTSEWLRRRKGVFTIQVGQKYWQ